METIVSLSMEPEADLIGHAEIHKLMFGFVHAMALRCAVELRIPDIINNSNGGAPITLAQIASKILGADSPDTACLSRIMTLLVRRGIFSASDGVGGKTLYGLTSFSTCLLTSSPEASLASVVLLSTHPFMCTPWNYLAESVRHRGCSAFERAHGKDLWGFMAEKPVYAKMFSDCMECRTRIEMRAVLAAYDGFGGLRSVVDAGGGTGVAVAEIVKSQPHVEGINFDLPNIIAAAPACPGVSHVCGDMFHIIPHAEAVFLKCVMHDWGDEECVKILKNCLKAIPRDTGKVIIVDIVFEPEGNGLNDDLAMTFNLSMSIYCSGGKERTQSEWKNLLKDGGFSSSRIIKTASLFSVIEAYPD